MARAGRSKGVFLAVFLALSLHGAASAAPDTIRIGVSLGLTGKYAEVGSMQKAAYLLWMDHVNENGGMLGSRVDVVVEDDQSDPERAVEIYRRFMEADGMDLVFGPYSSELTGAVLRVTADHGYPVLACGAASEKLWQQGYTNIFGVYTPAGRYTLGFLEMLKVHGVDSLAIVSADDAFSMSIAEGARKWATRFQQKVLYSRTFPKGLEDLDSIAREAMDSGAQVLLVCGHFEESVNMGKALSRVGWKPEAFYASVGPALDRFLEVMGDAAQGTFSSSQWEYHPSLPYPGARQFYESFVRVYGKEPAYQAATAYACGVILGKAVERSGSLDRERIREALQTMDTMSPLGRYGVDASGMQYRQFSLITQWQDGKRQIVWPNELRTSEPSFR
ncbi:MAG: amino acid ABC transporter substrate-binding protein [bacterium]|nr:MAG: amino acid ABC transporter substrate-binding protein [bacterium]